MNKHLYFIELDTTKSSLNKLKIFYDQIYLECFTNEDEQESLDSIIDYLYEGSKANGYKYHVVIAEYNNKIIGGAIFDYFDEPNSGIIEYIAIKDSLQSNGFGTLLYKHVIKVLNKDALELNNKLDYIFCEVESPEFAKLHNKVVKNIPFWNKNKFKKLKFNYIQPALSEGQKLIDILDFAVYDFNNNNKVSKESVLKVIRCYMKYCMRIQDPCNNDAYKYMSKHLKDKVFIDTTELILE